jgi:type I restriction enzyme M protein
MGVVVPHGVLFRGSSEREIRKGILEDDLLEAVIGMPEGLFYGTGIPAALLIINKKKLSDRKGKVIFINAELEYQEGKNQNILRNEDINKIVDIFNEFRDEKRYSKVATLDDISENDYSLNIRRYADTSPPPEQFDVQALLNGGIPIGEVEDDYIQETLQGIDVSRIFVKKDDNYYEFIDSIKSKEEIKKYLKTDNLAIISQFERWWDKYRISLISMNERLVDSERTMWSLLKEIGYE